MRAYNPPRNKLPESPINAFAGLQLKNKNAVIENITE